MRLRQGKPRLRRWEQWLLAVGAGWFAVYAAVILLHRWPPLLGDFPDWVTQGAMLARRMRGVPDAAYALKTYPVPNSTVTVLLGLLMLLVPWAVAAKVFLCGVLAAAWYGVWRLARASGADGLVWLVAPGAFFLNVDWWFGLVAYLLGVAVLFVLVAEVLERCRPGVLAGWLTVLFFTHMVPFAFGCLLLGCVAVVAGRARVWWACVPGVVLLAWYVVGRFAAGDPDRAGVGAAGAGSFALYKVNTVGKSLGFVNPGTAGHASVAAVLLGQGLFSGLFAVNLLVCAAVVWALGAAVVAWWRGRGTPVMGAVWVALLMCVPVYLVLPREALGVSDPGSRVLQIVLYVGLFLVGRRVRWAAAGSVVLAVAGLVLFVRGGFTVPRERGSGGLPVGVERLALAPYAVREGKYEELDRGGRGGAVFETGVFVRRR